jgi:hypothetical protein
MVGAMNIIAPTTETLNEMKNVRMMSVELNVNCLRCTDAQPLVEIND